MHQREGIHDHLENVVGIWAIVLHPMLEQRAQQIGVLGKEIDMLQMTLEGLPGYAVEYRVATVGGGFLPWVRDYNTKNSDGYAGITGKPFDRLQIRIVKI